MHVILVGAHLQLCLWGSPELLSEYIGQLVTELPYWTTPKPHGRVWGCVCCCSCEEHLVSNLKIKTTCWSIRLPLQSVALCLISAGFRFCESYSISTPNVLPYASAPLCLTMWCIMMCWLSIGATTVSHLIIRSSRQLADGGIFLILNLHHSLCVYVCTYSSSYFATART